MTYLGNGRFEFHIDNLTGGRRLTPEEMQQFLQSMSGNDGSTPLRYEGGYTHTRCGGPAEMAVGQNLSAYCKRCQVVVPSRELVKAT